ncbi:hypothetical protein G8C60_07750, partial [Cellulosimicrobium cellulans]|nr:hypothetical protein [Cellulosimicrobium cellulans]
MTTSRAEKSTTVRLDRRRAARRRKAAARLALVRARFAVLQTVSPRRAARLALDLWCTPPDGAGRRRDDRAVAGALSTVTTSSGARVVVESWDPHASADDAADGTAGHGAGA